MKQFEVGNTYQCRSACDHECIWKYTVIKRTAQTITVCDEWGKKTTLRINKEVSAGRNAETVFPLGRYSMAPVLTA